MATINERQQDSAALKRALVALKDMRAKLDAMERTKSEPIAIIGMGCRFPGGANSPEAFWQLLHDGLDGITDVPADRWDVDAYYDPDPEAAGKMYVRKSGFVDQIDQFEPQFFGISAREANSMDPQQRLLLEVTWEALEYAGLVPGHLSGSLTGVYIGMSTNDYARLQFNPDDMTNIDPYLGTGSSFSVAAGRLSYTLGLQGPTLTLDTACSSALVAVHLACQSLRTGQSDMALAGGVNLILSPDSTISMAKSRALAPDGLCKTFDASADGYGRGEGCGVVVLKRFSDAMADGDTILALIRGSATNHDGRSSGLTVPNGLAQQAVIRAALANASGIDPNQVSYAETHGTGTQLGDPIEVRALAAALCKDRPKDRPLLLGSVKANIGHAEAAAGMGSLIKVILAFQNEQIPPQIHFKQPNPHIDWESSPVKVVDGLTAWERGDTPRIAGINSFGISGTNSHLVLEEAPLPDASTPGAAERPFHILPLSANNEKALQDLAGHYERFFENHAEVPLEHVSYTASLGRTHFTERMAVIGKTTAEIREKLYGFGTGHENKAVIMGRAHGTSESKIAFLFTGQGSQYVNMAKQLYETQPIFRETLNQCNELLTPYLQQSLLSVIYSTNDQESLIDETAYTQPALFSIEYALAQLWQSWGIAPSVMLGHSIGEYVAACVAGVFSLEDGLKLVAKRGQLMQSLPHNGAMAAIFTDKATVMKRVAPYADEVSIATVNCPQNTVISGRSDAVQAILDDFATDGIKASRLAVSHAFHSPLMEPILDEFESVAAEIRFSKPKIGIVSNLTGELVKDDRMAKASYWRAHVRQAVQFHAGMETLREQGYELFLEIGPQPTLIGMGRQCLPGDKLVWLPSIRQRKDDWYQMLESLGMLFVHGLDINWNQFYKGYTYQKISLPTYPFQRQRYWFHQPKTSRILSRQMLHPLLGQAVRSPSLQDKVYETELGVEIQSFLNDHRLYETAVFPATGYVEMALAAARQTFEGQGFSLADVMIREPLTLPETGERTVQIVLRTKDPENTAFEIYSLNHDANKGKEDWSIHATGMVRTDPSEDEKIEDVDVDQLKETCTIEIPVTQHYERLAQLGLNYGQAFQGIQQIWQGEGEVLGKVALPANVLEESHSFYMHPAVLDACLQLLGAVTTSTKDEENSMVYVPVGFQTFKLHQTGHSQVWAHATFSEPILEEDGTPKDTLNGHIRLFNASGSLIAEITDLQMKQISRASIMRMSRKQFDDWLLEMNWIATTPSEMAETPLAKRWLIFADENGLGDEIVSLLRAQDVDCVLIRPGDEYRRIDESNYRLSPMRREHFVQLLADANASDPLDLGILHLWSLDNPFDAAREDRQRTTAALESAQQLMCGSILHLVQALLESSATLEGLWFVTRGVHSIKQEIVSGIAQSSVWGLGRTIAQEYPNWRFACVDLDPGANADQASMLFQEISSQRDDENQIALREGKRYMARLKHYQPQANALSVPSDQPFELIIPTPGVLDNLQLHSVERRTPQAGEVEIRVRATGLNFRDVLYALGMFPGPAVPLGSEIAGTVVAVGEGVSDLKVGDEVLGIANAAFRSFATVPADRIFIRPENVTVTQAASIPTAFLTAQFGLHHLAGVKSGDRVLIHAAAGGVGMAAVQLVQRAGAEVFATAGSPPKRELLRSMGVKHIFNSRTHDFADEIKQITQGKGVNIVLNSLADEFIPKSLSVLAEHGCFLEIGKRDDWDQAKVTQLNSTLTYHRYDLTVEIINNMPMIREMFSALLADFATGILQPMPVRTFPMQEAREAFRFMAQAKHIGKIVITQEDDSPLIRPDGTYLITGGLGSLGQITATWMIEQGAKHLALMSRHKPDETMQRSLDELMQTSEVEICTIQCDVAQITDVEKALVQIQNEMPPLRGVVHAAGVLDDGIVSQQNWERFERVLTPKVNGTWNLHLLTKNQPLDFFVLFSSATSLVGSAGQSNYTAANGFLDGLAHYRRANGLPATSINWGAWSEVGMAATMHKDGRARKTQEAESISPTDGMYVFEKLLLQQPVQVGVLPMDWNKFRLNLNGKAIPSLWRGLISVKSDAVQSVPKFRILDELNATPSEHQESMILQHVQQLVIRILGFDLSESLDTGRALTDLGIDSLMAVELKNKIDADFGMNIPVTYLLEDATVVGLSTTIHNLFRNGGENKQYPSEEAWKNRDNEDGASSVGAENAETLLENLGQLSDDQVNLLLENLLNEEDA